MKEIFDSLIVLDGTLQVWKLLVRILCAVIAGFLIGLENRSRSKDAGIKTHTLLCLTSCLLMIISKYGFYELSKFDGIQYDASRVSSTIISGLCFLGAGTVFYKQDAIKGLTTAVSMCLTISIGMCFGAGLLVIGSISAILIIVLQLVLHQDKGIFRSKKMIVVTAKFIAEDGYIEHFKEIFRIKHFVTFKIEKQDIGSVVSVEFFYKVKISSEELVEIAKNEPQIIMLEKY